MRGILQEVFFFKLVKRFVSWVCYKVAKWFVYCMFVCLRIVCNTTVKWFVMSLNVTSKLSDL